MRPALHLSRLPAPQRAVWPRLSATREDFVLYGGTAVALHAGHRESEDFDFFSSLPLDAERKRALPGRLDLEDAPVIQDDENTLGLGADIGGGVVKLSFFGGLPQPRLARPIAAPTGPRVASGLDLAGFKLAIAYKRNEENDVADLAALFESGETLPRAVAAMRILYPEQDLTAHAVAALTWFVDRERSPQGALTEARKRRIEAAVAAWRGEAPELPVESPGLSDPGFVEAVLR